MKKCNAANFSGDVVQLEGEGLRVFSPFSNSSADTNLNLHQEYLNQSHCYRKAFLIGIQGSFNNDIISKWTYSEDN